MQVVVQQRTQACDRAAKWTSEAFQQRPRPPALGKENCSFHDESDRCRHDVVTQGGNNTRSERHRKCRSVSSSSSTVSETSSSPLCCVISNDPQSSDELLSTKCDVRATVRGLLNGYQNRVDAASGESDFGKKLTQNRSRRVETSDTASRSLCDMLVAETTSGLNDFCFRLCNVNARPTSADLESVQQREVEGRSANSVVYCEEDISENVSDSKPVLETDSELST